MVRRTFSASVDRFMALYSGVYAPSTHAERYRRYRRLNQAVLECKALGVISTEDPSLMTPEDIISLSVHIREQNPELLPSSFAHDMSALACLCLYFNNDCVRVARVRCPLAFPSKSSPRKGSLSAEFVSSFIGKAAFRISDPNLFRSYMVSIVALATGGRTIEIQNLKIRDVDLQSGTVLFRVVKGSGQYGFVRRVPILPECMHLIERYLASTDACCFLFENHITGNRLSTNSLRRMKAVVSEDSGMYFDYRICRRTYAQRLLDLGVPVDSVSVILGHATSRTTEREYARVTNEAAILNVKNHLSMEDQSEDAGYKRMVHPPGFEPGRQAWKA